MEAHIYISHTYMLTFEPGNYRLSFWNPTHRWMGLNVAIRTSIVQETTLLPQQ